MRYYCETFPDAIMHVSPSVSMYIHHVMTGQIGLALISLANRSRSRGQQCLIVRYASLRPRSLSSCLTSFSTARHLLDGLPDLMSQHS